MKKLIDWLLSCKCHDIQPVKVKIGDKEWVGARYKQTLAYTADMMACQRGDKKAGDTYTDEQIYVIGQRPKLKGNWCFPCEGLDWYISGYIDSKQIKPEFAKFHPFGANFMLRPWNLPEPIDKFEVRPYHREPLTIVEDKI